MCLYFISCVMADCNDTGTVSDGMTHLETVRETLPERSFVWIFMENKIMDRDDKGDRTAEGNIKMRGEEEINL